jgi:hypothetical protein
LTNAPAFDSFEVVALTRQQRVYVAVLGLAGAALLIDRVILGGQTSPASASACQQADSPPPRPADNPRAHRELPPAKVIAAQRLAALAGGDVTEGADAFLIPAAWRSARTLPSGADEPVGADPAEIALVSSLKLTAVMTSGRPAARINDRLIVVGMKTPEGVELVKVGDRSATVRLPGGTEVTLELSPPGNPIPRR